jgi:hypothetical protein
LCGSLNCKCVDLCYLKSFFRHLSCVPKKCDRKKGTRRKFFTPDSVVLSTFRKQPALAHGTRKRWPQARQPSGSDSPKCFTLGWPVFAPALINTGHRLGRLAKFSHGNHARNFDSNLYPKPRTSPERTYEIFGHLSWPKVASRRANAHV